MIRLALALLLPGLALAEVWVDTHVHLRPTGGDFEAAAEALVRRMDAHGVEKALLMPPPRGSAEQRPYPEERITSLLDRYKGRLLFVGGGTSLNEMIHTTDAARVTRQVRADFEKEASSLLASGTKAFGEMAALHFSLGPDHPFEQASPDHPLFLLLADLAAKADVPIDLHLELVAEEADTPAWLRKASAKNPARLTANLAAFEALLAHNPKTRIVWQHVGWDDTGQQTPERVRALLDKHPNLFAGIHAVVEAKLDAMGRPTETHITDADRKLRPAWKKLIEAFPDRFMIGSDQFFDGEGYAARMPADYEETWALLAQLPSDLAKRVGRENAERVYRLK